MFKKLAAEALGLGDIGKIIPSQDYDKVDSDDYILSEDNERIFFLIKSKRDEYCFTNRALIHIDGASALDKKRILRRYEYYQFPFSNIALQTAGTIDLDVEISFHIGNVPLMISVSKGQIDQLKDLYKALLAIQQEVHHNQSILGFSVDSLQKAITTVAAGKQENVSKSQELQHVNEYVFNWSKSSYEKYNQKDFSAIFEKYINN
ncbi:YvbH-like oligomerisation region [Chryseobacterium oleae]|uniref:YvbH-like oligomerisation region n=1 Tax=Chryseobacterium oleae TaxID=491207 RepID=A0A1I4VRP9_CHROL|nr:PH domain-containing protein [Chryseobacterium oleae]SFN03805.1 YvbH-like oligomerisation region [Chryseobacterium oleae]